MINELNELFEIFAEIANRYWAITQRSGVTSGMRAWNAVADVAQVHGFVMLTTNAYECLIYPEEEPNDDAPGP